MALSNAERQQRHRAKLKRLARGAKAGRIPEQILAALAEVYLQAGTDLLRQPSPATREAERARADLEAAGFSVHVLRRALADAGQRAAVELLEKQVNRTLNSRAARCGQTGIGGEVLHGATRRTPRPVGRG